MITDEMCVGPFRCQALTGECCEVFFYEGRLRCPLSGCSDTNRQSDGVENQGFSIRDIFGTTLVTSLMYNVLTIIGATTAISTTTTTTTTTTTPTSTTAPTLRSCMYEIDVVYV